MKPLSSILVLNEDRAILQLMQDALSPDFQVYGADEPYTALDLLLTRQINLLIVDPFFPSARGLDLFGTIRAVSHLHRIPIVALTESEQYARLRLGPVQAMLLCPFSLSQLYDVVAATVRPCGEKEDARAA